jgi:hypothetical protein
MPRAHTIARGGRHSVSPVRPGLRLDECQADPATPRVAVVVASGTGTDADPYVVSTLPSDTCRAATFSVVDDVARVSVPEPVEIDYEPAEATQSP